MARGVDVKPSACDFPQRRKSELLVYRMEGNLPWLFPYSLDFSQSFNFEWGEKKFGKLKFRRRGQFGGGLIMSANTRTDVDARLVIFRVLFKCMLKFSNGYDQFNAPHGFWDTSSHRVPFSGLILENESEEGHAAALGSRCVTSGTFTVWHESPILRVEEQQLRDGCSRHRLPFSGLILENESEEGHTAALGSGCVTSGTFTVGRESPVLRVEEQQLRDGCSRWPETRDWGGTTAVGRCCGWWLAVVLLASREELVGELVCETFATEEPSEGVIASGGCQFSRGGGSLRDDESDDD
ncbi:zinc finger CCCH-type with G patch domain-containing protein [Striga asiatica]|uniref:Zinc finger CCCH-type with G patch domain-containing protein n=1 Tax=Striga asiatica TaxID=4170 RepID=A0A5A7PMU6_STRAF|nr:zinc finger CCCH-type with G patch domain-containing protein [Striga asiatica]